MQLKSLTYTSLASLDLTSGDLIDILQTARHLNALEGITGLLVFNGVRFLQVIEGSEAAIDELVRRLRTDHRHTGLEIRDERIVEERSFPDWSMELVEVSAAWMDARTEIEQLLPADLHPPIRQLIMRTTESIGGRVSLPD